MITGEYAVHRDEAMSYRDGDGIRFLRVHSDQGSLSATEYPVDPKVVTFIETHLGHRYVGEKSTPVMRFEFPDQQGIGSAEFYPEMNLISDTEASRQVVRRVLNSSFPDWENKRDVVLDQIKSNKWYDSSIARSLALVQQDEDVEVFVENTPMILYQGTGTFKTYDSAYLVNPNCVFNTNLRRVQPGVSADLPSFPLVQMNEIALRVISEPVQ